MMISKANRLPLSRSARWRSCLIRHYPGARGLLLVAILSLSGCGQYLDKHDTERLPPAHQTEYAEGSLPLTLRPDEYPQPAPLLLTLQQKRALGDVIGWGRFPAKINPAELIAQQLARSWQKVIAAQRGYPSAERLQALLAQAPLLTTQEQKQKNSDVIWEVLTSLSQEDINALSTDRQAVALWALRQGRAVTREEISQAFSVAPRRAADVMTYIMCDRSDAVAVHKEVVRVASGHRVAMFLVTSVTTRPDAPVASAGGRKPRTEVSEAARLREQEALAQAAKSFLFQRRGSPGLS